MRKIIPFAVLLVLLGLLFFWGKNSFLPSDNLRPELSLAEQERLAMATFKELYEYAEPRKKAANLPKMVAMYQTIIGRCPDVSLAEESSLRLIELYFRDFQPPKKDEAMKVYGEFMTKYPESVLAAAVMATVEHYLYTHEFWDDLLAFTEKANESLSTEDLPASPLTWFYLSEANYHFKNFAKAGKGYELIVRYFPNSRISERAKRRISQLANVSIKSN